MRLCETLKLDVFVKADNLFVFSSDVDLEELTLFLLSLICGYLRFSRQLFHRKLAFALYFFKDRS